MLPAEDLQKAKDLLAEKESSQESFPEKLRRKVSVFSHYHRLTDTPKTLQPESISKAYRLVLDFLAALDKR